MAAHSAEDLANWLRKLLRKIRSLFTKYSSYGITDVRYVTFNNFQAILEHHIVMNQMFSAFEKGIVDDNTAKNLFGFSIKDANYADTIENMGMYEKVAFTVLVNFNVEVFSKVILQGLKKQNPPEGFYPVIRDLMTELNLPDANNKVRDLYTMAAIRNALHSNGIHTKPDIPPYQIRGNTFEFRKGKPVECASWPHLIAALERVFDLLDEIATDQKVKNLPTLSWQYIPI